jgi:hypothetical protein
MPVKRTPAEAEAFKQLAEAARRVRDAQRQAEVERLKKRAEGLGFSLNPIQEKDGRR